MKGRAAMRASEWCDLNAFRTHCFFWELIALLLVGVAFQGGAASYYWDGGTANIGSNGDGVSAGGNGTWDLAIQNWDQGNALAHVAWPAGGDAVFGGTAGTVTLGASYSVNHFKIETADYTFTLTGNRTFSALTNFSGTGLASATFQATSGSRTLVIGGAGNPNADYSGRLRNGGGTLNFRLGANRELTLSGTNSSYTGLTEIYAGTLHIASVANGGVNSSIGASTAAAANLAFGNATGTATLDVNSSAPAETDRLFTLGGTSAGLSHKVQNNGAGTLNFTSTGSIAFGGTANLTRGLTLGGANNGDNIFRPVLGNNGSGAVSLTKAGAGKWILTGDNTYTGDTTVSGGTLLVNGSTASGSAVSVSSGATLGGTGTIAGSVTFSLGAFALLTNGAPLTISGALSLNNNKVRLNLSNDVPIGSYTLATYGGALSGSFASAPVVVGGSFAAGTISYITSGAGSVVLHVEAAPPSATTTIVDSSFNPSYLGKSVTFTATMAPALGSAVPAGTVQFRTNGTAMGAPVAVSAGFSPNGMASISTRDLPVGTITVTADYSATGLFFNSSGQLPGGQVVNALPANSNSLIPYIADFPMLPNPLVVRDWKQTALDYHQLAFNPSATGQYLPLLNEYSINTTAGFSGPTFGLPSYVGVTPSGGEALTALGAVLGGTLAGLNMADLNGKDRVQQSEVFYSIVNDRGVVMNNVNSQGSGSAWYDIFPSILFYEIGSRHPGRPSLQDKMAAIADSWTTALPVLSNNWEHTGFDFNTMTPTDFAWKEPDMAIGIAWLEYMAYLQFRDAKYLAAADTCMTQMNNRANNPFYEVLGYYGPLLASRMNAELGRSYSTRKHLNWIFASTSNARPGWGCENSRWGSYDAYGLMGSTTDSFGYAFGMNTYVAAGIIAPTVRYDPQHARLLGRWLLHVAANANLFYPDTLPANMQSSAVWVQQTGVQCISYEGVRRFGTTIPYATGDATEPIQDLNPYGTWGSGFMAALFQTSNIPGILQVDCVATEAFAPATCPTFLYYNPYATQQTVSVNIGPDARHLYDLVTGAFLATNVSGTATVSVAADSAIVLALCPATNAISQSGRRLAIGGIVVDYWNALLDGDGDGLPDWWESRYYGNSTNAMPQTLAANQFSNLQNYWLGLDPTNPDSKFRSEVSLQAGTGYPQISWSSVGGKRYAVEYADDLAGGGANFSSALIVAETNVPAGVEGRLIFVDDGTLTGGVATTHSRFYRVKLVSP